MQQMLSLVLELTVVIIWNTLIRKYCWGMGIMLGYCEQEYYGVLLGYYGVKKKEVMLGYCNDFVLPVTTSDQGRDTCLEPSCWQAGSCCSLLYTFLDTRHMNDEPSKETLPWEHEYSLSCCLATITTYRYLKSKNREDDNGSIKRCGSISEWYGNSISFAVIVNRIVAWHSNQTAITNTKREEDLCSSL